MSDCIDIGYGTSVISSVQSITRVVGQSSIHGAGICASACSLEGRVTRGSNCWFRNLIQVTQALENSSNANIGSAC